MKLVLIMFITFSQYNFEARKHAYYPINTNLIISIMKHLIRDNQDINATIFIILSNYYVSSFTHNDIFDCATTHVNT